VRTLLKRGECLEEEGGDLPRGPQGRAVALDLRAIRKRRADQQRRRADPRRAACRRRTGFGTDSPAGRQFVERMLAAIESCLRQSRALLDLLVEAIRAHRSVGEPPSLVPDGA